MIRTLKLYFFAAMIRGFHENLRATIIYYTNYWELLFMKTKFFNWTQIRSKTGSKDYSFVCFYELRFKLFRNKIFRWKLLEKFKKNNIAIIKKSWIVGYVLIAGKRLIVLEKKFIFSRLFLRGLESKKQN